MYKLLLHYAAIFPRIVIATAGLLAFAAFKEDKGYHRCRYKGFKIQEGVSLSL